MYILKKNNSPILRVRNLESVYNMKNFSCLFERLFNVEFNGVFFFGISFFRFGDIDVFVLCKLATS